MTWIIAHGGQPEAAVVKSSARHGLHGSLHETSGPAPPASRFVLPAGALD
jgi:hypothetical protein